MSLLYSKAMEAFKRDAELQKQGKLQAVKSTGKKSQ